MPSIIFVCTGNMCRSPMAEGVMKQILQAAGRIDFTITSMGIYGMDHNPAAPVAVEICALHDVDISKHQARPLIPQEMNRADYIYVMDIKQRDFINTFLPKFADRVALLGAWPGKDIPKLEIKDPMGGSKKDFTNTFNLITKHIKRIVPILLEEFPH